MAESIWQDTPHLRRNPLTGDEVLVSPHRSQRPWQGQQEKPPAESLPSYDPKCYLCPGNSRAGGIVNPAYTDTFVFDNDFAALLPDVADAHEESDDLFVRHTAPGQCRVVCFSPRHDLTLPELPPSAIENVIATWAAQSAELGAKPGIGYVQVFENKGAMMGCSNPHPHSQIWATRDIPNEPRKELATQTEYLQRHGRPLLADYLTEETRRAERMVVPGEHFSAIVPFWAIWPFEVMIVAHRAVAYLQELTPPEIASLADVMRQVTTRYDNLFEISFPYSMGFHQAPFDGLSHKEWVLHAHFYPPLLRSATVRKFMVGYELMAMPQRDLTSEAVADRLRALSSIHFRQTSGV